MIGKAVVGVILAAIIVYGLIEAWPLLLGPSLTIISPLEGETIPSGIVHVRGRVTHSSAFTLNGAPLLGYEKGDFSTTLTFSHGTSILEFTAKDRFGRTITQTRTIYVP